MNPIHPRAVRKGSEAHYADAAYYDHAYHRRKDDVRFYEGLGVRSRGPVLELGVGSGRVACALARAGVSVVGVERMAEMLERARAHVARLPRAARARVELRRGDIRSLRLRGRFPLVIAPFNVLMHLYTRRDMERTLATVRAHLAPRGRFVFDVLLPDPGALARDPDRNFRCGFVRRPEQGRRFAYDESFAYDSVAQIQLVTMIFRDESSSEANFVVPLSQRQWFPAELEAILHYNGFEVVHRHGGFDGSPLTSESDSQIVVARRR